MPIYDPEKSKMPTWGYECDSSKPMRLYKIAGGIFWDYGKNGLGTFTWQRQQAVEGTRFVRVDCRVINR